MMGQMSDLAKFAMENKRYSNFRFHTFSSCTANNSWKRATLWLQSLEFDLEEVDFRLDSLRFRGKGYYWNH